MSVRTGTTVRTVIDGKPIKFTVKKELACQRIHPREMEVILTEKGNYILRQTDTDLLGCKDPNKNKDRFKYSVTLYNIHKSLEELVDNLDYDNPLDFSIIQELGLIDAICVEV